MPDVGTYALALDGRKRPGRRHLLERRPRTVERHVRRRNAPRAWPRCSPAAPCGRAGASAPCRPRWRATTRSATTWARSGRTTTASAPPVSHATGCSRSHARSRVRCSRRRSTFARHACPSSSAASTGVLADAGALPGCVLAPGVGGRRAVPHHRRDAGHAAERARKAAGARCARPCPIGCPSCACATCAWVTRWSTSPSPRRRARSRSRCCVGRATWTSSSVCRRPRR